MFKQELVFKVSTFFPVISQDNVFLRKRFGIIPPSFGIPETAAIHLGRLGVAVSSSSILTSRQAIGK